MIRPLVLSRRRCNDGGLKRKLREKRSSRTARRRRVTDPGVRAPRPHKHRARAPRFGRAPSPGRGPWRHRVRVERGDPIARTRCSWAAIRTSYCSRAERAFGPTTRTAPRRGRHATNYEAPRVTQAPAVSGLVGGVGATGISATAVAGRALAERRSLAFARRVAVPGSLSVAHERYGSTGRHPSVGLMATTLNCDPLRTTAYDAPEAARTNSTCPRTTPSAGSGTSRRPERFTSASATSRRSRARSCSTRSGAAGSMPARRRVASRCWEARPTSAPKPVGGERPAVDAVEPDRSPAPDLGIEPQRVRGDGDAVPRGR